MLLNNDIGSLQNSLEHPAPAKRGTQLTQDDFMKLLLAQMRLQSPENPFDSNTMMQQISQLTTLSATKEMEETVKGLNTSLGTSQVLSAAQLVGKKVQVPGETSPLIAGEGLRNALIIPQNAEKVTVTIKDANDRIVKTMEMGPQAAGVLDFSWDGRDAANIQQSPGIYKISATGLVKGNDVNIPVAGTFTVNSVALDKNTRGVILNLDGKGGVNMDEVIKIM